MMEDRIDELEKLKRIYKRRIIFLIVLICFGILIGIFAIFNSNSNKGCDYSLGTGEIDYYNARFEKYIGEKKIGTTVKQLCSTIMTNNTNSDDEYMYVYIKMGDITGLDTREKWKNSDAARNSNEIVTIRNQINSSRRYNVIAAYDEKGLIMGIGIIEIPSSNAIQNITNNTNNI